MPSPHIPAHILCVVVGSFLGMQPTAESPESWLVLYNVNVPDSVAWARWYAGAHAIPAENLLGLDACAAEHLPDVAAAESQVFAPVRMFLAANPALANRIVGILVGFRVPGHYGAMAYGVGGLSIACGLQHPACRTFGVNPDCCHTDGNLLPVSGRPTRASMTPGHYMTARIDAVNLDAAKSLTLRAKALWAARRVIAGNYAYYDYTDAILPDSTWFWLKMAVHDPRLSTLPWMGFDEDTAQTPKDAFRIGAHDVKNWNNARLRGKPAGSRILAYDLNSWGATTVRSTTAEGGRFVPNALDAGYAAAIGSTGEPNTITAPYPDTLLAGLMAGWTLGEVFYVANPYDNFTWELVGDPFLKVPDWSGAPLATPRADFDMDGDVDLDDFSRLANCVTGNGTAAQPGCEASDFDLDGDVDIADFVIFCECFNGPNRPPLATCGI